MRYAAFSRFFFKGLTGLGLFLSSYYATAQGTSQPVCGFGHVNTLQGFEAHPAEDRFKKDTLAEDNDAIIIIPVVVHIIHNGGPENIPDAVVLDQIRVLNEDFGRFGGGANTHPAGADTRIRFCLAQQDPEGRPTSGINRVKSPYTDLKTDNEMLTKNLSRWDRTRYLNIWVVRCIDDCGGTQIKAGYAYRASNISRVSKKDMDGIVINYRYFGYQRLTSPAEYRLGHTTTHEVGHYLDLLHTWGGDGPGQGGCGDDDEIGDTPDCDGPFSSRRTMGQCTRPVQCGNPRMVENYMDYSTDQCLNVFTLGQKIKMRVAIFQYRPGLISYPNLVTTGCHDQFVKANPTVENSLEIHPNPSRGTLFLYPKFVEKQDVTIRIYNALGQLMSTFQVAGLNFDRATVQLTGLGKGHYTMQVSIPDQTWTQQLILLEDN